MEVYKILGRLGLLKIFSIGFKIPTGISLSVKNPPFLAHPFRPNQNSKPVIFVFLTKPKDGKSSILKHYFIYEIMLLL